MRIGQVDRDIAAAFGEVGAEQRADQAFLVVAIGAQAILAANLVGTERVIVADGDRRFAAGNTGIKIKDGDAVSGYLSLTDAPAIAELVVHGRYQTIDLTRLGYERVETNTPYAEEGIL